MIERVERAAAGLQKYVSVYAILLLSVLTLYGALHWIVDVFGPDEDGEPRVELLTGEAAEKRIEQELAKARAAKKAGND